MNSVKVKLSEISHLITKGTTPTTLGFSYKTKGVRFLRAQNIINGKVNFFDDDLYIDDETHQALSRSQIQNGDLLVSIAGSIGRSGIVNSNNDKLNCNQAVAIVRLKKEVCSAYIAHILNSRNVQNQIFNSTVTGVISNLSLTQLGGLTIKLPPLAEQKRIAELLDTADRIIRLREQAIAKLDELAQSVFENLLSTNDKIEKKCLSELTIKVDSINPSELYGEDEFTYIDIGSVNNEHKVIVNPSFVKGVDAPSRARQLVKINDVLISTVRPNLNAVAMVMKEFKWPIGSTGFCVLRCDERKILPDIVFAIAKSKPFIKSMMNSATGASYPAVTDKIVKAYKVPVFKMEDQTKYVEFMRRVNKMKDQFNDYANASVLLHNSLQHQSFAVN